MVWIYIEPMPPILLLLLQATSIIAQLEKERKMNLALVHQMLPPKIADDLRAGRPILPEAFNNVTIFFSDVEGFTTISAAVSPIKVSLGPHKSFKSRTIHI